MTMYPPAGAVDRDVAVDAIVAALADRTHYVIVGAVDDDACDVADRLAGLACTSYVDAGVDRVLVSDHAGAPCASNMVVASVGIWTVPKSAVSAAELSSALDQSIPGDGSRDIVILHRDDGAVRWPQLFVSALQRCDPQAAAIIAASDVASMN